MPNFTVTYQSHGVASGKWIVPAVESGIVGCYVDGKPYQPASQPLCALIDQRHVKAFKRAHWVDFGLSDVLRLDLQDAGGRPIGSLFAKLNK